MDRTLSSCCAGVTGDVSAFSLCPSGDDDTPFDASLRIALRLGVFDTGRDKTQPVAPDF